MTIQTRILQQVAAQEAKYQMHVAKYDAILQSCRLCDVVHTLLV